MAISQPRMGSNAVMFDYTLIPPDKPFMPKIVKNQKSQLRKAQIRNSQVKVQTKNKTRKKK